MAISSFQGSIPFLYLLEILDNFRRYRRENWAEMD